MEDSSNPITHLSNPEPKSTAAVEDAATVASEQAPAGLGDSTAMASVFTAAESVDINAAFAAATNVTSAQTISLSETLAACGKTLSRAAKQEKSSRTTLYRGLVDVLAAAEVAYRQPELLVALAAEKSVKTTLASWRTPFLVPLKLARPDLDSKLASLYAKVLNNIAARGLSGEAALKLLTEHGISALAAEETKRQKARKQGTEVTPAEDPIETFCRTRTPSPLPEALRPVGLGKDIRFALMIVGDHEGRFVAWDFDTDEKRTMTAVRQAAKRRKQD